MAIPLLLLFFCCFLSISYGLIDYPIVTTADVPTTWTNRRAGTTSELTNWVLADGSAVRPIFFVRGSLGLKPAFAFAFYSNRATIPNNNLFYLVTFLLPRSDDDFILTPPVIVWVANKDRPVGENAVFSFTAAGDLQLKDADGTLVWSTNMAGHSVSRVIFTDGGNLELVDKKNHVKWQSFDYPIDTWLPGQSIFYGDKLVSRSSSNDVVPGDYYLSVSRQGINLFLNGSSNSIGNRRFKRGLISDEKLGNSGNIQALSKFARFNFKNYSGDGFRYIVLENNGNLSVYHLERVFSVLFNVILEGNLLVS